MEFSSIAVPVGTNAGAPQDDQVTSIWTAPYIEIASIYAGAWHIDTQKSQSPIRCPCYQPLVS